VGTSLPPFDRRAAPVSGKKERAPLLDLRIADVVTFLTVRRYGSVSAAARELGVTPSQVSKAVDRLGAEIGKRLIARTSRGVTLTDDAERLAPRMQEVVSRVSLLRGEPDPLPEVTIAAPSYLMTHLIAPAAMALPRWRVRGIQLAPAHMRAYATERLFDVAVVIGDVRLHESWCTAAVGTLRSALFASRSLATTLKPFPVHPDRLRDLPFISPIIVVNGQALPADDQCPVPRGSRLLGHEAQNIGLGLELAAATNQLVFGPVIAARPFVERGQLEEIPVSGWNVLDTVHLGCHGEAVLARVQKTLQKAVAGVLSHAETRP
jgi:DNA-binding transcriptional LysR family regulator